MAEVNDILRERGSKYGEFEENGRIAQTIRDVVRTGPAWAKMRPDAKLAIDEIALKIARAVSGDPEFIDNWDDIEGYAKRVGLRIKGRKVI